MLSKVNKVIDAKAVLALGALASILGAGAITGFAQTETSQTTLDLTINAGVLTMYAGDDTDNNDICTPADDSTTVETITCNASERTGTLSALNVASVRQNTTTTINDILFEDLRGLASATYTITANMCDLVDGAKSIALGTNPDALADDTDPDASIAVGEEGSLFATLDPSAVGADVDVLRPQAAIDEFTGNASLYSQGSKTTVIDTATAVTVFETTASVIPGRADLDGATLKHRVPAFVEAGSYSCQVTFTVA